MKYMLSFTVNGAPADVAVGPTETLLDVLRDRLGFTGAKRGCETGDCGACTVLVDGRSVRSCITLALTVQGKAVTTVEGLARDGKPHPLQQAFHDHGASQCGFCTPGMIVSLAELLEKNPEPCRDDARATIAGNLCRCTGYVKIIDAAMAAARSPHKKGGPA